MRRGENRWERERARLRVNVADCGRLWQIAADCGRLRQIVADAPTCRAVDREDGDGILDIADCNRLLFVHLRDGAMTKPRQKRPGDGEMRGGEGAMRGRCGVDAGRCGGRTRLLDELADLFPLRLLGVELGLAGGARRLHVVRSHAKEGERRSWKEARGEEIWGDLGRCGEIWGDLGRSPTCMWCE